MGSTKTRRRRSSGRANATNKLAVFILIAVAVAVYVYFNRSPDAVGALIDVLLGGETPVVSTAPTARPARPTARPTSKPPAPTSRPATGGGPQVDGRAVLGADYPSRPSKLQRAKVLKVVDGDTVDVQLGGEEVRLRLIGLDTPESVDPRKPVECYAVEASNKAKELLGGQTVYLEPDPSQSERDRYGRLLRFIWLGDGTLYNLEMIAQGYAFEYTYDNKYKYQAAFKRVQEQARDGSVGLWSPTTCNGEHRPADG